MDASANSDLKKQIAGGAANMVTIIGNWRKRGEGERVSNMQSSQLDVSLSTKPSSARFVGPSTQSNSSLCKVISDLLIMYLRSYLIIINIIYTGAYFYCCN